MPNTNTINIIKYPNRKYYLSKTQAKLYGCPPGYLSLEDIVAMAEAFKKKYHV